MKISNSKESSNENEHDIYTAGMSASNEEDMNATERYNIFQFQLFDRFLSSGPFLEIGAGAGRITDLVIAAFKGESIVVSEPSPHFFRILESKYAAPSQILLERYETSELLAKYGSNYFGSIYSVHVMEHVKDDAKFLSESVEMLRPGGVLIILVPALQFLFSELDNNIGHFRRYDKGMIRELIKQAGLEDSVTTRALFYSNFLGVFASLFFLKYGKLSYQGGHGKKSRFMRLYSIYSRYCIPLVQALEKFIPLPFGLNLTIVLEKSKTGI